MLRSHAALITCWAILVLVLARIVAGCAPVPREVDNAMPDGGTERADCLNDGGSWISAELEGGRRAWCSQGLEVSP